MEMMLDAREGGRGRRRRGAEEEPQMTKRKRGRDARPQRLGHESDRTTSSPPWEPGPSPLWLLLAGDRWRGGSLLPTTCHECHSSLRRPRPARQQPASRPPAPKRSRETTNGPRRPKHPAACLDGSRFFSQLTWDPKDESRS